MKGQRREMQCPGRAVGCCVFLLYTRLHASCSQAWLGLHCLLLLTWKLQVVALHRDT